MKILVVCYKYPPKFSGYGKQAKAVNETITKRESGFNFKILTGKFQINNNEDSDRIKIVPLGIKMMNKVNSNLHFYFFSLLVFFQVILNRNKVDIVHCIKAGPEAALAILASKLVKKPTIVKIAGDELSDLERNRGNKLQRGIRKLRDYLILKADGFISINNDIKDRLFKRGIDQTRIFEVPNGVDISRFFKVSQKEKESLRIRLNVPLNEVVIIFSGSIRKRKGIFDLLNTLKGLKVDKKIYVLICGPIHEKKKCFYSLINNINVKSKGITVKYKGNVHNIDSYFKLSDILVLPSYSEGLPNVLLEGGSSGLAMIASDIPGCKDIIEDGVTGLLFEAGDLESLKNSLLKLINSPDYRKRLSMASYKRSRENYSISLIADKYIDLYFSMLKKQDKR